MRVPAVKTTSGSILAAAILLLALSGCGGVGDQPELGLVTGTVMLDNEPLSGIAVTFLPDNGRPATGTTDENGDYKLIYIGKTPGCKVGHSRVEIGYAEEEDEGVETEGDDAVQTPGDTEQKDIPARYNAESELEADVKPGENVFNFDLKR
ncbi:MAG TPA: hypothetical protein VL132_15380 [Planctomycetaceae bacterium]|nr:hypothetical protein [Planctomycetaceae bacterium]